MKSANMPDAILGMTLVTHQTGPEGKVVKRLLVEEGAPIQDELYIGLVVDRSTQRVTVMASSEGGTEIETVAEETPELIHKVSVDPKTGLTTAEAEGLAAKIGIADASGPGGGQTDTGALPGVLGQGRLARGNQSADRDQRCTRDRARRQDQFR